MLELKDHHYNLAGWSTPNRINTDPVVCKVNSIRYGCSWSNSPLVITISNPNINIGYNLIELTTEYIAPYNGIKFPGCAGQYLITMNLLNASDSTSLGLHTFFTTIHAHDVLNMNASSIVKDIDT